MVNYILPLRPQPIAEDTYRYDQEWRGLPNELILQIIENLSIADGLDWNIQLASKQMQQLVLPHLYSNFTMTVAKLKVFLRLPTKRKYRHHISEKLQSPAYAAAEKTLRHARSMIFPTSLHPYGNHLLRFLNRPRFRSLDTITQVLIVHTQGNWLNRAQFTCAEPQSRYPRLLKYSRGLAELRAEPCHLSDDLQRELRFAVSFHSDRHC